MKLPPSRLPRGGRLAWSGWGEPPWLKAGIAESDLASLAASLLLARYWPRDEQSPGLARDLAQLLLADHWSAAGAQLFLACFFVVVGDFDSAHRAYRGTLVDPAPAPDPEACWQRLAAALGPEVLTQVQAWLERQDRSLPSAVLTAWQRDKDRVWTALRYAAMEALSAYGSGDTTRSSG